MPMFRKRPVEIEARRFDPRLGPGEALAKWCNGKLCAVRLGPSERFLLIPTLEGEMRADPGDWIIKGVRGGSFTRVGPTHSS